MTDIPNVIQLGLKRRFRLIDCQGESRSRVMSDLQDTAKALGIDLATQSKERRQRLSKEAWDDWVKCTKALVSTADDPIPHAIRFLQDMKGRAS